MKILKWLIDSHIWIALGSSALAIFSFQSIHSEVDLLILAFLFTSTLFVYNFQTLIKWRNRKTSSASRSFVKLSHVKALTAASFLALIPISFSLQFDKVSFLGIFALISLLYAAQLRWSKKAKTDLRSIPFIKIYLIAIVWVGVTVAFPLYYKEQIFGFNEFLLLLMFTLYFVGITIPFDIRDIHYDQEKMNTIPQTIGIRSARILSLTLLLIACALSNFLYSQAFLDFGLMLLSIFVFSISGLFSFLSDNSKPDHFFTGLIDGTILIFGFAHFL